MFGFAGRAMHQYQQAKTAPHEEVTREEFIARMLASGVTKEKAEFHAGLAERLGTGALVGGKILSIRKG